MREPGAIDESVVVNANRVLWPKIRHGCGIPLRGTGTDPKTRILKDGWNKHDGTCRVDLYTFVEDKRVLSKFFVTNNKLAALVHERPRYFDRRPRYSSMIRSQSAGTRIRLCIRESVTLVVQPT